MLEEIANKKPYHFDRVIIILRTRMPFDATQGTGLEEGPRSWNEPGCPSTPLSVKDWRINQDFWSTLFREVNISILKSHISHLTSISCTPQFSYTRLRLQFRVILRLRLYCLW